MGVTSDIKNRLTGQGRVEDTETLTKGTSFTGIKEDQGLVPQASRPRVSRSWREPQGHIGGSWMTVWTRSQTLPTHLFGCRGQDTCHTSVSVHLGVERKDP